MDKGSDSDGRITQLKTVMENRINVFLSVYAPCTADTIFFYLLSAYVLKFSDFEIIGADMNFVMFVKFR